MNNPPRVDAVVVTFNRCQKLATTLARLRAQTVAPARIWVVDNASTDGTGAFLAAQAGLSVLSLTQNRGGAGGFARGIRAAVRDGADQVWVMDDDSYPEPDALARLLAGVAAATAAGLAPGFACSRVVWTDDTACRMNVPRPTPDYPRLTTRERPLLLVDGASFVSCLLPAGGVRRHGLPYEEFFIWADDLEYTRRLAQDGPGVLVLDSVAVHDTATNDGVDYGLVTPQSVWKFKYGARNMVFFCRRLDGLPRLLWFVLKASGEMARARRPFRLRLAIWWAMVRGLVFAPRRRGVDDPLPD